MGRSKLSLYGSVLIAILGLEIAFQFGLMTLYELTFTKLILTIFSRFSAGLSEFLLAGLATYFAFGIAFGLLGLVFARYLAEEFGVTFAALTAAVLAYVAFLNEFYGNEKLAYVMLAIYFGSMALAVIFKKYRTFVRIAAIIVAFIYGIFYYAERASGAAIVASMVYAMTVTGMSPIIVRTGKRLELAVRRRFRRPKYVFLAVFTLFFAVLVLVDSIFVLLDGAIVYFLYDATTPVVFAILLFSAGILASAASLTIGDATVVAAAIDPKAAPEAAGIGLLGALAFGLRRLRVYLKVVFFVFILLLSLVIAGEEEDEEKKKKAVDEALAFGITRFSADDILYMFFPYLVAILVYAKRDLKKLYAALYVALTNSFSLLLFAIGSALYTFLIALTVSGVAGFVLYLLVSLVYPISLSLDAIALATAAMFPIVYAVIGPMSAAARGYVMYEILKENEDLIAELEAEVERSKPEAAEEAAPAQVNQIEAFGTFMNEAAELIKSVSGRAKTAGRIEAEHGERFMRKLLEKRFRVFLDARIRVRRGRNAIRTSQSKGRVS